MSYKELTEQLGEGNEALTLVKAVSEEIVVSQNKISCDRLFEICFHFAGHRSSTQEFSAGPSEFLPDLNFLCKIVLKPSNVIPLLLF
jgi:hypothetical protein